MTSKPNTTAMKGDGKPALVPKLRFPEFRGADGWTSKTFKDFAAINKGEQLSASEKDDDAIYPHFNGGMSPSSYTRKKNTDANTIIISEGGNSCGFIQFVTVPFWCGGHCYAVTPITTIVTGCLYYALQAKQRQIMALRVGSGLPNIQKSILEKFVLALPRAIPEQQKVAECLGSVDELIAAQARKLDALKTHKKGLMQQLFPHEGETQPRLRFPEFSGQWNATQLEGLCDGIYSGRDKNASEGEFDLYGSTGIIGKTAVPSHSGPHILVARVGANAGLLNKADGKFGVTDNTLVINPKPSAHIDFIFYYLGNTKLNRFIFGSGQPLITGSILKVLPVLIPNISEQRKISECLSSLDDLIAAQSERVESLIAHKKGLMQQLFPISKDYA